MSIIPIENSFYPVFLSCLSILPEPVPLRKTCLALSASIQQFFQLFQVLGSLGVTGGHRLLEQGAGLFRIAVHHVAHAPQVVGTKVGVALKRVQRLGVLFGLQQVDGFVERQEFGVGLRLVEHLDVSRVAKLREEVLLHIVIGLATVELHEKSQATHFLLGIPHRSGVDDVQHLLPGVHVAVCNEPAQKSPRLLVVFHLEIGR